MTSFFLLHLYLLACVLLALSHGAAYQRSSPGPPTSSAPVPVIIDTDIGSYIDDSFAIAFALQSSSYLNVKLVVTATDNTTERAKIAAKFLTFAGRDDIPVGIGAANTNKTNHTLWGWADDFNLSGYRGGVLDFDETVAKMIEIIECSDQIVEILAIAPFINFPLYLNYFPPEILRKVRVKAMAGSIYRGYDNSSTPSAEYNVRICPSCFNTMLQAKWASEVWLAPLDTSGVDTLKPNQLQNLSHTNEGLTVALDQHIIYWCTKGVIPCQLNIATVTFPDPVATLLSLPTANAYVEMYEMNLIADETGHTTVNNSHGAQANVALYWQGNLSGLTKFKLYLTNIIAGIPAM